MTSPSGSSEDVDALRRAELRRLAEADSQSGARIGICRNLAEAMCSKGQRLWVAGYLIGGDRVSGKSPVDFGSDALVGVSILTQMAGELGLGAVSLLEDGNTYAAALVRQIVEVEYLTWVFANDKKQAEAWLRSRREERLQFWSPKTLRKLSEGHVP